MSEPNQFNQVSGANLGRRYDIHDMDDEASESEMDQYYRKRRRGDYYSTDEEGESSSNEIDLDQEEVDDDDIALVRKGMRCEMKHQYMGREYTHGIISWVDEKPRSSPMEEEGKRVNNADLASFALLIRNRPNYDETEARDTSVHSIVVQSPLIRRCLKGLLARYPNISLDTKFVTFESPFQPLFYEWNNIKKAIKSEADETTRSHLQLLLEALEPEFHGVFSSVKEFKRHDAISFDHLWAIFKPGDYIYSLKGKTHIALQLREDPKRITPARGPGSDYLSLSCQCIDWNGQQFIRRPQVINIPEYPGTSGIKSLKAYPLEFHSQKEKLKKVLRSRGEKFKGLAGTHFVAYKGVTANEKPYYVNGRVVIDSNAYFRFNPGHDFSPSRQFNDDAADSIFFNDGEISDVDDSALQRTLDDIFMDEDQLLICRPVVRGYALKIKKWQDFEIDAIREIRWNSEVFDYLAIPENLKGLLLAISNAQHESASSFDDIIEGKGKGIVMLLNGPPGVGKTLTAESVAETMRVPLISISAGDLGLEPQSVQKGLSEAFEMVTMWRAVLLLDEADIFMEQRTTDNLKRNELVSIFLQNLEYYEGTLFLTTNRVKSLDEAFESRIHLSIDYLELSRESRRRIWKNFLGRIKGDFKISEEDLAAISLVDVNGREIKNIMKLADLLANSQKMPLSASHIKSILRVRQENSKIKKSKGWNEMKDM